MTNCSSEFLPENVSALGTDVKTATWRFKRMEKNEEGIEVEKKARGI